MDLLKDRLGPVYLRYLGAAFGSALISSIYGVVDMAMVGQYQGPDATAALAVVAPVWNIIYSLGLLMGVGGSVLLSALRGESEENIGRSNQYFTAAMLGGSVLAVLCWLGVIFFDRQLLMAFGGSGEILELARKYVYPIKFVVPSFLMNQLLAAFLRNDGDPGLATKAVLAGGIFNVFGDYFCVFTLNMGMMGAGLATAIGSMISTVMMLTHFISKKNTLKLTAMEQPLKKLRKIGTTGFSTFFIDVAMGFLTILFNRQILKYLGTDALSVYGIIINVSTIVQCCAYSVGQASQPIISMNYGARKGKRIRQVLRYALITSLIFGILWTLAAELFPNGFVRIFMAPTQEILRIAPAIIRVYGCSFLLLPINIFSTYYFQATMKPGVSFAVSVGRGAVLSGILIVLLPLVAGADSVWWAMPLTELLMIFFVLWQLKKSLRELMTPAE